MTKSDNEESTDTTDEWSVSWKDSENTTIEQTLRLTAGYLNPDFFEGTIDGLTVLLIPRERFISAMRTDLIPGDIDG